MTSHSTSPAMSARTRYAVVAVLVISLLVGAGLIYLLAAQGGSSGEDVVDESPAPPVTHEPAPETTSAQATEEPTTTEPSPTPEREPTTAAALTVHPTATQTAIDVLDEGGTAADAAVAVAAVLSVIEPYYSNLIAGETAALYHDGGTGEIRSLEAVGTVGSDFDLDAYRSRGATGFGLYQSLVPGSWDGWITLLQEEGELELDRLLEPAITLARDGHPATAATATQIRSALESNALNAPAREIYVPGGNPVSAGGTIVQSDFADTLQGIADVYTSAGDREAGLSAARDHVYTGDLGQRLLDASREGGATFTAEDMASYSSRIVDPIRLDYAGHTVYQNPPASQGLTMLIALNILSGADLSAENADAADTAHTMIEAVKLAMADREAYIGDPAFTDVPVDELLDPAYGRRQLERIDLNTSANWPIEPGLDEDTTTFQIVDHDGNAIAVTTSTGYQFITAGDTGVMMNNRMRYMTATDSSSPNFLEPGKRVRYTGNPYMVTGEDGLRLLGGNIGGDSQAQVQTQHVVGVLNFGLTAPEAIARHRFVTQAQPGSIAPHNAPNRVRIETTTPGTVVDSLRQRGQDVNLTSGVGPFGYGSMIELIDGGREVSLGIEPRLETSTGQTSPPD